MQRTRLIMKNQLPTALCCVTFCGMVLVLLMHVWSLGSVGVALNRSNPSTPQQHADANLDRKNVLRRIRNSLHSNVYQTPRTENAPLIEQMVEKEVFIE